MFMAKRDRQIGIQLVVVWTTTRHVVTVVGGFCASKTFVGEIH